MELPLKTGPSFVFRLLAGVGLAALLGGIGLAAARPAHSTGGPIPVAVTNAVQDRDSPARQPFQGTTEYVILDGSNFATPSTFDRAITVPAGKRLVIQTVSFSLIQPSPGESVQGLITTTAGGIDATYALPLVSNEGTPIPGATQSVTLFADPGSTVSFAGYRNGTSGQEVIDFTVSGYLVNVP